METNRNRMNTKLKGIIFIISLLTMVTSGFAQNGKMSDKTSEEKARLMTDKQKEKIDFYDDLKQQMYDINLKYIKEMEVIVKGGRSMETVRKLRDMSDRKDKEVKTVLDKDQYKIYLKQKEDMRSQMRANRGGGR
ncbi:MAG: hypothetical protein ABJH98_07885 [Reichenbachiella sp.]|uniref:hypothetical protein n=1 Tax=Reichenbachiella sp. TaxID=2184521 RepID=UPI0032986529